MRVHVAAADAQQLGEALDALLPGEPDLAYANFPPLAERGDALHALHRRRFAEARDALATLVARDGDGHPLACARLARRPFDSEHFGLPLAAIDRPLGVGDGERRAAAFSELFGEAFARLRAAGVAHVAVRASSDDAAASIALQRLGAAHVGTSVSWTCALDGRPAPPPPVGIDLAALAADELRALAAPATKRLVEWSERAFRNGPFVFDGTLPLERALALYPAWMRKVFSGEWADGAMVARDRGEVVAVIPMQLVRDLSEAAGARVFGRSLAATLPGHRGLCTALMREMIASRPFGADWMEGDTPVTTFGTINMFAKVGFRYLRATSIFHRRLDRA
jgi:hypothetical protein